jgi:hypothetical protein
MTVSKNNTNNRSLTSALAALAAVLLLCFFICRGSTSAYEEYGFQAAITRRQQQSKSINPSLIT